LCPPLLRGSAALLPDAALFRSRRWSTGTGENRRRRGSRRWGGSRAQVQRRLTTTSRYSLGTTMVPSPERLKSRISASRSASSAEDRKSTRLNSSHVKISYAVFG